jgi:hypothetical protein
MISKHMVLLTASRLVIGFIGVLVFGVAHATASYAFIYAPVLGGPSGGDLVVDPVALEFKSLLDTRGYATDLISMADASTTNFSNYRKILIGDNTGSLNLWGTAVEATNINSYGKPIVGIGEGGYAFFGLSGSKLGWPNGWHGPQDTWVVNDPSHQVFNLPNNITLGPGNTVQVLNTPSNEVGIYAPSFPPGFDGLGGELLPTNHYGLALQNNTDFLWGFSAAPSDFTAVGKDLFINVVAYPVPEPETYAMMLAGLGLVSFMTRRRKNKQFKLNNN